MDTTLVYSQVVGLDMEKCGMKDDDETEDMIFSFVFIAITILTVLFVVVGIACVIWSLI